MPLISSVAALFLVVIGLAVISIVVLLSVCHRVFGQSVRVMPNISCPVQIIASKIELVADDAVSRHEICRIQNYTLSIIFITVVTQFPELSRTGPPRTIAPAIRSSGNIACESPGWSSPWGHRGVGSSRPTI